MIKSSIGLTFLRQEKRGGGNLNEALKWFERSEHLDKNNLFNLFNKATILTKKGEDEKALEILRSLLSKSPREYQIHLAIGNIYAKIGNKTEALVSFQKACDLNPKDNQRIKSYMDALS